MLKSANTRLGWWALLLVSLAATALNLPGHISHAQDVVSISPDDDAAAVVANHPPGTTFILEEGIHRFWRVEPRDGNTFIGEGDEGDTILSGAREIFFQPQGQYWIAAVQPEDGLPPESSRCKPDFPRCNFTQDLYLDDFPLREVDSLDAVIPETFYFDYAQNLIYIVDDPRDYVAEISVTLDAFWGEADNVLIRNVTIEKYASPGQRGAIHGDRTTNWIIDHVIVRLNHGTGIRLGEGMQVINSKMFRNGQIGIAGLGDNVLVENNEIARNNYAGYRDGWEAGGAKFVRTHNLIVRGNYVHNNLGPGLWTDIDNMNTLYEDNVVMGNDGVGIFHEISFAAVIRNNTVMLNATEGRLWQSWLWGAQILVSTSSDVEIYANEIVVSAVGGNGITIVQQDRGISDTYGTRRAYNNRIYDNVITYLGHTGVSGAAADYNVDAFWREGNNTFAANTYYVTLGGRTRSHWSWSDGDADWEEMQALGQEVDGRVIEMEMPAPQREIFVAPTPTALPPDEAAPTETPPAPDAPDVPDAPPPTPPVDQGINPGDG